MEPTRKRVKKEEPTTDHEDGSLEEHDGHGPVPMDSNTIMDDQKQQLAAFLSALAQQTPLNASVKQTSTGPSN